MKTARGIKETNNLMQGSIIKGMLSFAVHVFLGQLLQQLYNLADAWVIGNYAENDAFAAVSSAGNLIFLITGFFGGIGIGGGVVISNYYGAGKKDLVNSAVHANILFGIIASALSTIIGLLAVPRLLVLMNTPDSVFPQSVTYFRIYFAGVATVILFNICMCIMRALGDSIHPLYYLLVSSLTNVVLDFLFVAVFKGGVFGAAIATVLSQGLSVALCLLRMCKKENPYAIRLRYLKYDSRMMREVIRQGLPTGIQNSVISIGNIVVQTNINGFGSFAMSGHGAYSKIEGVVFLPIVCMSMTLPTFISQNLGAGNVKRAKKGAVIGILFGIVLAELVGILLYFVAPSVLALFVDTKEAIGYGVIHAKTASLFFFLLAFSHCAAGVLRGCCKAIIPMITMLSFWCGIRIIYVTQILKIIPEFRMISWAYPITWALSSIVFLVFLLKSDWTRK